MFNIRRYKPALSVAGLSCALALVVSACAGTGAAGPQADAAGAKTVDAGSADQTLASMLPQAIRDKGSMRVASNVEYPPFEYYDEDNKTIIGLDKDIADALSAKFGVKLEFTNMSFDSIIPALAAKRFDMAMSAMTDNEERRAEVDFVDYFTSGGGFLVKNGNPKHVEGLEDICGLTVAIDKGTTEIEDAKQASEDCVAAGNPEVKTTIYPGTSKIVLALQNGRADVAMIDTSAGAYIAEQNKGQFEVPAGSYAPRPYGIVVPKGSAALANALKAGIDALMADGTYTKILAKWGQEVGALKSTTINDGAGL